MNVLSLTHPRSHSGGGEDASYARMCYTIRRRPPFYLQRSTTSSVLALHVRLQWNFGTTIGIIMMPKQKEERRSKDSNLK